MARSNLSIVQEAIEIQGFILVSVNGQNRQAKAVKVVDGDWVTDILTADLKGYVRIKSTKDAVVKQAKWLIEHADEIRANRTAKAAEATNWAMGS